MSRVAKVSFVFRLKDQRHQKVNMKRNVKNMNEANEKDNVTIKENEKENMKRNVKENVKGRTLVLLHISQSRGSQRA